LNAPIPEDDGEVLYYPDDILRFLLNSSSPVASNLKSLKISRLEQTLDVNFMKLVLDSIPKLEKLKFEDCTFDRNTMTALQDRDCQLKRLVLYECTGVSDEFIFPVFSLKLLEDLTIAGCTITEESVVAIALNTSIKDLRINANLGATGLKTILEHNRTLTALSVSGTSCPTEIIDMLENNEALASVGLDFLDSDWIEVYKRCPRIKFLTVTQADSEEYL
jgi:hypothetical protein